MDTEKTQKDHIHIHPLTMTYGSSSHGLVKQAPRTPRAIMQEYEKVVRPLADLQRELSKFIRDPQSFSDVKAHVEEMTSAFAKLLKAQGVDRIVSAWWGESDESDGKDSVLGAFHELHRSAAGALSGLKPTVRKRTAVRKLAKAGAKKKIAVKKKR